MTAVPPDERMMRARLIGVDAPEWMEMVHAVPHDVYQLPAYAALAARYERGQAAAASVEDGRGRRLLVPLILREVEGDLVDAVSPYGYPGVLSDRPADGAFVADAMESVKEVLAERNVVTLFLRLHPLMPVDGLESSGLIVWHQTVAIDLSRSANDLRADMRTNHRRDVDKSLRDGTRVVFETTPSRRAEFEALYAAAMVRMQASDYYRYDSGYFERLFEDLAGYVRLATVLVDDDVAAAGVYTECGGIVEMHLAATEPYYAARRPTKVLVYAVCQTARAQGHRWLHLGGGRGSAEDSLFHFKAGFSNGRAAFGTLRSVILAEPYRRLVAAVGSDEDGDLDGYFPCYRRREVLVGAEHR